MTPHQARLALQAAVSQAVDDEHRALRDYRALRRLTRPATLRAGMPPTGTFPDRDGAPGSVDHATGRVVE